METDLKDFSANVRFPRQRIATAPRAAGKAMKATRNSLIVFGVIEKRAVMVVSAVRKPVEEQQFWGLRPEWQRLTVTEGCRQGFQ